jgi:hypothetical protein
VLDADPLRISQVLANLPTHTTKYSEQRRDGAGDLITGTRCPIRSASVRGAGAQVLREEAFDRFQQLDAF